MRTDLKCPFCPEIRSSRADIESHVHVFHHQTHTAKERAYGILTARPVTDVVTDLPGQVADITPKCVCGMRIVPAPQDGSVQWLHAPGNGTPHHQVVPVRGTLPDREPTDLVGRLEAAGRQIEDLKTQADAVIAWLDALDARATAPAAVRRATLNDVWDRLIEINDLRAAGLVRGMIALLPEGDGS